MSYVLNLCFMLYLSKQKLFNYYLPMFLSVVLVAGAIGVYLTLKPDVPVAEAAVSFDNSLFNSNISGGGNGPRSFSYTVSGSNPILFVALEIDSSQTVTGVTYNGVSMTQTDSIVPRSTITDYLFMLQAPATGTHNVTVSYTGSPNLRGCAVSYDGAAQTGQPDNHKTDSQTNDPTTVSLTTNANDSWMVMFSEDANADGLSITAGGTLRQGDGGSNTFAFFDSNGAIAPAGSHSMTIEHTFNNVALKSLVASFAPIQSGIGSQLGGKVRQVGGKVVIGASVPRVAQSQICTGSDTTNNSTTCAFSANVKKGNYILVYGDGGVITSWNAPTLSAGTATVGTFTSQGTCVTNGSGLASAICFWTVPVTGTGSATITISTANTSATYLNGGVVEITGTNGIVDGTAYGGFNCGGCTGAALNSLTAGDLVITAIAGASINPTAPSPFTFFVNTTDTNGFYTNLGSYISAAGGSYTPSWTSGNSGQDGSIAFQPY